ncbi:hypothetical protein J3F82_001220 [Coemansia sp. RSA 637]|nr:hypothetical protein J3F82_001220 [Coemansia sp. RSA 637]
MESPEWLVDYYSSVMDVVSPSCGLSTAVASFVLITMYKDTSSTIRFLRFVLKHYMRVTVCVAFVLLVPLVFAQAEFDGVYLYPQWTFGSTTRNIVFVCLSFYVWVGVLLINFAVVIVAVVFKLRKRVPSISARETLAAPAMRHLEQRMRRKARILVLYPLSAVVFFGPSLVFYWVQALMLERTRFTRTVWMVTMVVSPVQAVYDFGVFVVLPPVQRVVKWNCELHKESEEPLFGAREAANAPMSNEEAWAQDVG